MKPAITFISIKPRRYEANSRSANLEISRFLFWKPKVHKTQPLAPMLSHMNPFHIQQV
jgi:hypothetical protein